MRGSQLRGRVGIGPRTTLKPARSKMGSVPKNMLSSAGALAAGPGVGFDGWGTVFKGVPGGGTDEGDGNALAAGFGADGDAWDYPDVLFVYSWSGPRLLDAGEFLPGATAAQPTGSSPRVCEDARGDGASGQVFHGRAAPVGTRSFAGSLFHWGPETRGNMHQQLLPQLREERP